MRGVQEPGYLLKDLELSQGPALGASKAFLLHADGGSDDSEAFLESVCMGSWGHVCACLLYFFCKSSVIRKVSS